MLPRQHARQASILLAGAAHLRQQLRRVADRYRWPILATALVALIAGSAWSVAQLNISWRTVDWWPLALMISLAIPATILLNALELKLCAAWLHRRLAFRQAIGVTSLGTVANVLPVPASLALRAKALSEAGAGLKDVGIVLGLAAGLWAFMALVVTALSLPAGEMALATIALGTAGVGLCVLLLWRRSGGWITVGFVGVRAAMTVLLVVRLLLCFAALGIAASLADAGVLAGAGVLGNAATIVPAGLGVTEYAGAGLATLRQGSAAAAFLVLTLDRTIALAANGIVVIVAGLLPDESLRRRRVDELQRRRQPCSEPGRL